MADHPSLEALQELRAGERRPAVHQHVAACDVCRQHLSLLERLDAEMTSLPEFRAPPDEWARVSARLGPAPRREPWRERARRWLPARATGRQWAAASAFGIALFGTGLLTGVGLEGSRGAALSPEAAALAQLQTLRDGGQAVAARAAVAKGLADAAREALRDDPDNPTLHGLYYVLATEQVPWAQAKSAPLSASFDSATYRETRREALETLEVIGRADAAPQPAAGVRDVRAVGPLAPGGLLGRGSNAFGGARLEPLTAQLAAVVAGPSQGILVLDVIPGTPADRAGLRPGDILVSAQDAPLRTMSGLFAAASDPAGVRLEWSRGGARHAGVVRLHE